MMFSSPAMSIYRFQFSAKLANIDHDQFCSLTFQGGLHEFNIADFDFVESFIAAPALC